LDYVLQAGYDPISLDDTCVLEEFAAGHLQPVYGKTPLQIITRDGKPAVLNAAEEPYTVYRLDATR
jgi:hypothetical protein